MDRFQNFARSILIEPIEKVGENAGQSIGRPIQTILPPSKPHVNYTDVCQRARVVRKALHCFGRVDRSIDRFHLPLIVKVELEGLDRHGPRLPALLRNRPGQMLLHQLLDFNAVSIQ